MLNINILKQSSTEFLKRENIERSVVSTDPIFIPRWNRGRNSLWEESRCSAGKTRVALSQIGRYLWFVLFEGSVIAVEYFRKYIKVFTRSHIPGSLCIVTRNKFNKVIHQKMHRKKSTQKSPNRTKTIIGLPLHCFFYELISTVLSCIPNGISSREWKKLNHKLTQGPNTTASSLHRSPAWWTAIWNDIYVDLYGDINVVLEANSICALHHLRATHLITQ